MTRFIFCSDYWHPLALDSAYEDEVNAVQKLGLSYSLIDFEKLEQREAARSVCRVEPSDTEEIAIYRGWMLKPRAYERLYQTLRSREKWMVPGPLLSLAMARLQACRH